MPSFNSLGELGAYLQGRLATMPRAERAALEEGSAHLLERVKSIPGHYQSNPVWPPLAEATVDDRTRRGYAPDEPLLRDGTLRDSYQRKVIDDHHAAVGSDHAVAPLMENGTAKMPPRPVLGAAIAQDGQRVADIVGKHVAHHLAGRE